MFFKLLFQSLLVFLAIDAVWISQIASPWMKKATPHLLAANPNWLAAGLFYLLYLSILLYLVIIPILKQNLGLSTLVTQSFLFGLVCYATYDLTNLAVMKNYPWTLALADMLWGGLLTAITALILYRLNT